MRSRTSGQEAPAHDHDPIHGYFHPAERCISILPNTQNFRNGLFAGDSERSIAREATNPSRPRRGDTAMTEARTDAAPAQTVATPPAPEPPPGAPEPPAEAAKSRAPAANRIPSIIVGVVIVAVASLSIWYLVRGEPL